jgi:diguanylate cyclase (GGDEF)-like protein
MRRRVAALVFNLLWCWLGIAQAASWREVAVTPFEAASPGSDTPSEMVSIALMQDGSGFLWGGSEIGLLRWDGIRFRRYCADAKERFGLRDCLARSLFTGQDGTLWVGTASGGLARYDPASDQFETILLGDDSAETRSIVTMAGDGAAGLWVATLGGLFHIDQAGRTLARLRHEGGVPGSLPAHQVQSVLVDRAGRIWVGGGGGLARADPGGAGFAEIKLGEGAAPDVSHLMQDKAGRIWAGTRDEGAYVIAPSGAVSHIEPLAAAEDGDSGTEITAIAEVSGRVWLGTAGEGIIEVEGDGTSLRHIIHDPDVPRSLDNNNIFALIQDRSGLVWVSTPHGLSHANPQNEDSLFALHGHAQAALGLGVGDATAIVVRQDGTMWVGSDHDGLDIVAPDLRRVRHLPIHRVFAMAQEPGGRVFIGTRGGLLVSDGSGSRTLPLIVPDRRRNAPVFALLEHDGVVWVGGQEDGVYALRVGMSGEVKLLRHLMAPLLTANPVDQIIAAPDGRVAVATEGGVTLVAGPDGPVQRITAGLASAHPVSMAFDSSGRLWIGHNDAGIDVMELGAGNTARLVRHIGREDGLPNLAACALVEDRAGHMWLSTANGIASVNERNFVVRGYGRADGLDLIGFWNDSAAALPDGSILFGGLEGLARVRPEGVTDWSYTPPLAVTDVRIGGKPTALGSLGHLGDAPTLTVPAHTQGFAIEFASLDFSAPRLNQYRYRLLGFESQWIDADASHRIAAYTNIPPGNYALEVEGTNRNKSFSPQVTRIAVHVLPAWYQTLWFRCVEAVLALSVVACVVQARTILLRARQRELERQVAERTAALSASEQQLHQMAYFDALTALPNRRAFNKAFRDALEQQAPVDFALALVDLDGFKSVNDTLGHDAGDELLLFAAARLREAIREGDFVARLGGDEFAILLMGVSVASRATAICERVVTSMAQPMFLRVGEARIGASVGVALFPRHGRDGEELYRHADYALYEAKRTGRGKWRWFGSEVTG